MCIHFGRYVNALWHQSNGRHPQKRLSEWSGKKRYRERALLRYNYKFCKWNTIETRESTRNDRNNCFLAAAAASLTWLISTYLGTLHETTTRFSPEFSLRRSLFHTRFEMFNNQKLWWIHFRFVYTLKCFSPLSLHHQYHISLSIVLFLYLRVCVSRKHATHSKNFNQVHFKNSIMVSSHFIPENYLKHFDDNFTACISLF